MDFVFPVFMALAGLAVGSFLNVCSDRLPAGKSIAYPPSHCDSCRRRLTLLELVPVLAYVVLGGRCRTCGFRIPVRVPLVEAVAGGAFFGIALAFGPSFQTLRLALYAALFIVVFVIDLETGFILNKVVYPAFPIVFVLSALEPGIGPLWAVVGAAAGFTMFLLIYILANAGFGQNAFGLGDVTLAALIGLATGFPTVLVAMFVTFILGGVVAIVLLVSGLRRRKDIVPYGPFMVVGASVALLWGHPIATWYLGLLGVTLR